MAAIDTLSEAFNQLGLLMEKPVSPESNMTVGILILIVVIVIVASQVLPKGRI